MLPWSLNKLICTQACDWTSSNYLSCIHQWVSGHDSSAVQKLLPFIFEFIPNLWTTKDISVQGSSSFLAQFNKSVLALPAFEKHSEPYNQYVWMMLWIRFESFIYSAPAFYPFLFAHLFHFLFQLLNISSESGLKLAAVFTGWYKLQVEEKNHR